MGRNLAWVLALALALAACDTTKPVSPPKRVAASTSAAASAPAATTAPAAPVAAVLQKPAGGFTALSGNVTVDAGYIVAAGAGNIVAMGGGNVVSTTGAKNLVAQGGGNIVAQGGGNIIAQGGGNVISGNGSAARAPERRGLLQAADLLPAVGMEVSVVDLATDTPLPVGKDAAGNDVYTVFTDAQGHYELYLPAGLEAGANVLVVARVSDQDDPRLAYDVATQPGTAVAVDEDSALLTRFVRLSYAGAMETMLKRLLDPTPGAAKDLIASFNGSTVPSAALEGIFGPVLDEIRTSMQARGIGAAGVRDEAERQADALLAKVDLATIAVDVGYGDVGEKYAGPALIKALTGARQEVSAKLKTQAGPPYFAAVPLFQTNGVTVRKATDVMEFIVTKYFSDRKLFNGKDPELALAAVGVETTRAAALMKLSRAGGSGISKAIASTFLNGDTLASLAKRVQATPKPSAVAIPNLKSSRPSPKPSP